MSADPLIRHAAVAGSFYPSDPADCTAELETLLSEAAAQSHEAATEQRVIAKAVIAPHAGWIYSGPVAATAFARVAPRAPSIHRVVVVGPAHTVPLRAMAVSGAQRWATPLGSVAIDHALRQEALACPDVRVDDEAHVAEHCIEVLVPFLQHLLGSFTLLPVVVGEVSRSSVEGLLDAVWGGDETLVVLSSDLSHYLDHATASTVDERTAAAIVARRPSAISSRDACGVFALRGLLGRARAHDLTIDLLDLRTSADTAGTPERVVGYGAFAVLEPTR